MPCGLQLVRRSRELVGDQTVASRTRDQAAAIQEQAARNGTSARSDLCFGALDEQSGTWHYGLLAQWWAELNRAELTWSHAEFLVTVDDYCAKADSRRRKAGNGA